MINRNDKKPKCPLNIFAPIFVGIHILKYKFGDYV